MRELPDGPPLDRVRRTMEQYGMLYPDKSPLGQTGKNQQASTQQTALEAKFLERVTAIKGETVFYRCWLQNWNIYKGCLESYESRFIFLAFEMVNLLSELSEQPSYMHIAKLDCDLLTCKKML